MSAATVPVWHRGPMTASDDVPDQLAFECPRCGEAATERFYGPCTACRSHLTATLGGPARDVEVAAYEPKMNVTPNQVASKD
jgi:hypothetical protein